MDDPVESTEHIHFIGICGKGMGAIAAAIARASWRVSGSDDGVYPPMSDYLARAGIRFSSPYHPDNIPTEATRFVVGKRVEADNPELQAALGSGRPVLSFPLFLGDHVLGGSRRAVVAGGVGKTTTTAMLAWILEATGFKPDYFVGGMPLNFDHPARLDGADVAVLEGDEYASCFNDPLPKFMHYHPEVLVITNVLEDHPDLYPDLESVRELFVNLIRSLPPHGLLVTATDDPGSRGLASHAPCRAVSVGFGPGDDLTINPLKTGPFGSRFAFGGAVVELPMCGRMNQLNGAMAMAAARHLGAGFPACAAALTRFAGVGNRQAAEEHGGVTVVFDKATHPHALSMLLESLRQRYPARRLVSLIQPRATGRRQWVYQRQLPGALAAADLVLMMPPYEHQPRAGQQWAGGTFSIDQLADEVVALGVAVESLDPDLDLAGPFSQSIRPGDVLLVTLPEQALKLRDSVRRALADRD